MSLVDAVIVLLWSVAGFTLQGAVGFGMGLLSSPVFMLIDPRLVPGPVLASTMVFTLAGASRDRRTGVPLGDDWACCRDGTGCRVACVASG